MNDYRPQCDAVLRRRAIELWGRKKNAVRWYRAVRWLDSQHLWIEHGGPARCVIGANGPSAGLRRAA